MMKRSTPATFIYGAVALMLPALFGACSRDLPSGPPGGAGAIPFNLTIPGERPSADYYAVSGALTEDVLSEDGDSLIYLPGHSFYAQFEKNGSELPDIVRLNGYALGKHLNGQDTFRLRDAFGAVVFASNTWTLIDTAADDSSTYMVEALNTLDTISPFTTRKLVRSDTSLVLRWKPPTSASNGIFLVWEAPDFTWKTFIQDNGNYTVRPSDLQKLVGSGTLRMARYRNIVQTYNGRQLLLTRIAERVYPVTVQP